MKEFTSFASICVAFLAIVGGTAYLVHDGHYLFGAAVLLLGMMAYPFLKECVKALIK